MEPKIVKLPALKVIGLSGGFTSETRTEIPKLWQRFMERADEVKKRVGKKFYGIAHVNVDDNPEFVYVASVEVEEINKDKPAGMVARSIAAGTFAVFSHRGGVEKIPETLALIWEKWWPASGRELGPSPTIEIYDYRFKPGSEDSEFDIYVSIK